MELGSQIKSLRLARGVTQETVAAALGVSAPFGARLCLQSVVCYTLCRRCRENAVAAGEGKGI